MYIFFFFNDTATTEIYTLSLHDALPIYIELNEVMDKCTEKLNRGSAMALLPMGIFLALYLVTSIITKDFYKMPVIIALLARSEEHTSELQSRQYLVCRLLLEKKKKITKL